MSNSSYRVKEYETVHHITSRIAHKVRFLQEEAERNDLVEMIRRAADFAGVRLLGWCIMINHFHMLVFLPTPVEVDEKEVLRRYGVLKGAKGAAALEGKLAKLRQEGETGCKEAALLIDALRKRMYSIDEFVKIVKQWFSEEYNHRNGHTGTLWEGAYHDRVVAYRRKDMEECLGYIHLNPIRAAACATFDGYAWSSYSAFKKGDEVAIAGMRFVSTTRTLNQTESIPMDAESAAPAEEAGGEAAGEMPEDNAEVSSAQNAVQAMPETNSAQEPLKYQNLNVPHEKPIASMVNLSRLGTDGEYFSEDEILKQTQLFIDVKVLNGYQDSESGKMHYTLQILDVYGGELSQEEIKLETESAYILEQNHEYVLPVTADFNLAYECAPQIEKTQDNKLVIPNGWYTLMQSDNTPVLYDSYGIDDYFYDRMYLTKDLNLDLLIQKWESL